MFPQTTTQQQTKYYDDYPTSPWTEAYHSCPADSSDRNHSSAMPKRPFDHETQAPTHDALSAIYNQGY